MTSFMIKWSAEDGTDRSHLPTKSKLEEEMGRLKITWTVTEESECSRSCSQQPIMFLEELD